MRRSIGILSAFTFLAAPLSTLALAGSPAALLSQMSFRGNPHAMEAELHMHHGDTHVSVWMKGAAEGKTPAIAKAWEDFTIDVSSDGRFVRTKGAVRVAHGAAYIKLLSVEGNMDITELQEWTTKPWVKITMLEEAMHQPTFIAGLTAGMQSVDNAITEQDVRTLLDTVTDALFTIESERYQSGMAYSLRLAPNALHRAVQAVESSVIGNALGFDREDMDLPENLPVNLHIRVNTNSTGDLVFAKWYAATATQGISFVMQGNTQWQNRPVNVEIPKETISFEEFSGGMGMHTFGSNLWNMPSRDWDELLEEEDEWSKDEMEDDTEWEDSAEQVSTPRAYHPRPRTMERIPQREQCTATAGTPAFLQQARKGGCNLPARDDYRVNNANAVTKRLRHPRARK